MKLKNANPHDLIGKTIIYRNDYWRVVSIEGEKLRLDYGWAGSKKGLLHFRHLRDCRPYLTMDDVGRKYPRLVRALRWSCILTDSEAKNALQGYLTTGRSFVGSEAVAHIGGASRAIEQALLCRHLVRKQARRARVDALAA